MTPSLKQKAPYGAWKSPITADLIVSESIGLGELPLMESTSIGSKVVRQKGDGRFWCVVKPMAPLRM